MKISRIAKAAVLAATVTLAAPSVFAQNIAIVNGKAVPKARADAMIEQILKNQQPGQPPQARTPDLEQKVKDEIVMREIFIQEAERRGLNTSPDYKVQMEFARQSILIRALVFQLDDVPAELRLHRGAGDFALLQLQQCLGELGDVVAGVGPIQVTTVLGRARVLGVLLGQLFKLGAALDLGQQVLGFGFVLDQDVASAQFLGAIGSLDLVVLGAGFGLGHLVLGLEVLEQRAAQFPEFDEVKAQIIQRGTQAKMAKFRDDLKAKAKTDYKFSN